MAESRPPLQETDHPMKDFDVWRKKVDEHFGDDIKLIPDVDVLRTIRGYHDQEPRDELTFNGIQLLINAVKEKDFPNMGFNLKIEPELDAKMKKAMEFCSYGQDKQGHPIMIENVAKYDTTALKQLYTDHPDDCINYRLKVYSKAWNKKHQFNKQNGTMMYKQINIFNMENIGMTSVNAIYSILQKFIKLEGDLFPETVYKMYIINTGWTFRMLWKVVSQFIHEHTQKKIQILGYKDAYLPELLKEIDIDQIPEQFGGKGTAPIPWGDAWYSEEVTPQFPNESKAVEEKSEKAAVPKEAAEAEKTEG